MTASVPRRIEGGSMDGSFGEANDTHRQGAGRDTARIALSMGLRI